MYRPGDDAKRQSDVLMRQLDTITDPTKLMMVIGDMQERLGAGDDVAMLTLLVSLKAQLNRLEQRAGASVH